MQYYVTNALERLQHTNPKRPKYVPHLWEIPAYDKILQMAPYTDESGILENKTTKRIQ